jgi:RNA polymerase sigma factor (sigma-70 family)
VAVRSEAARPDSDFLLEHRPFVLKLCRILLRDAEESDDAAQQVFLNAYCAIGAGVRPLNGRAWLAQIARNECRSRARRAAAHLEAPLPEALADDRIEPSDAAAQRVLVARLRDELAALPDRQREAVLLREFRGLSYNELAAAMDESGPAVESLLQRARRRLATRLEEVRGPVLGLAFALDWVRNAVSRLWPGPAATEAVATGGAAAVAAKLAAAGVVAVGVGFAGGDLHRAPPSPSGPPGAQSGPSRDGSARTRPARRPSGVVTSEPSGHGGSHEGADAGDGRSGDGRREDVSSGPGPGPGSGPGPGERFSEPVGGGVEPSPSGPGGGGDSGSSGPGSTGSGSLDEGSGPPSSGPERVEQTSLSGPSDSAGSDGSGSGSSDSGARSTGSGSSGPGSGSPDSGGSGSESGSGSSGHGGSDSSGSASGD